MQQSVPFYFCWLPCSSQQCKVFSVFRKCNNRFPLHCCRFATYFLLPLTVLSIKCQDSCLSHPACSAHAPQFHLCPLRFHHIFRHYLINGAIFGKKLLNIKCVFWFSLQLLSQTLLIIGRIQRDIVVNVHNSSWKITVIFVKLKFWQIFQKKKSFINIKFYKSQFSGRKVVPCELTDKQIWQNKYSLFLWSWTKYKHVVAGDVALKHAYTQVSNTKSLSKKRNPFT